MALALAGSLSQGVPLGKVLRPEPGDKAPGFSAAATTGETIALGDFLGRQAVVLAFFPKAFTAG